MRSQNVVTLLCDQKGENILFKMCEKLNKSNSLPVFSNPKNGEKKEIEYNEI